MLLIDWYLTPTVAVFQLHFVYRGGKILKTASDFHTGYTITHLTLSHSFQRIEVKA